MSEANLQISGDAFLANIMSSAFVEKRTQKKEAEKAHEENSRKITVLKEDCKALEASLARFKDYLAVHKADKQLPPAIAKTETLKASLSIQKQTAEACEKEMARLTESEEKKQGQISHGW